MSKEQVRQIIDSYPLTDHDVLSKIHSLKPVKDLAPEDARILRLYTDGSCLKDFQHPLRTTYSGWGFSLNEFKNGDAKLLRDQFGHIQNGSPLMGELEAIRNGLQFIDRPSAVSIVTDSLHAIEMLINPEGVKKEYAKFEAENRRGCKRARELFTAIRAQEALDNNKNVIASEISWIRAHHIDKVPSHELPSIADADLYHEKMLLMDLYGNRRADNNAKEGSEEAVRVGIRGLHHAERKVLRDVNFIDKHKDSKCQDVQKKITRLKQTGQWKSYEKQARQVFSNINGNWSAKNEAIRFVARNPHDFLASGTLESLFTDQDRQSIRHERFAIKEKHERKCIDYREPLKSSREQEFPSSSRANGQKKPPGRKYRSSCPDMTN